MQHLTVFNQVTGCYVDVL